MQPPASEHHNAYPESGDVDDLAEPIENCVVLNSGSPPELRHFIVGIGASAGGLEALTHLFPRLPTNLGLAYVVVQHLSPTYRSMLTQLLGRETSMPVVEVEDGTVPQPNTVYITPPNRNVTLCDKQLRLIEPAPETVPKPSVNLFFNSLAEEAGENALGVILSGTGSDGASGIHSIKAAGGFTFAQDPATAKYGGMPQAAIDGGSVDWILAPEHIGEEIGLIAQNRGTLPISESMTDSPASLKKLLGKVRARTKVDFGQYKEATVWRRIERRMVATHTSNLSSYIDLVDREPEELDRLCKDILISVTAFFRDPEAFEGLQKAIADLLLTKAPGDEIRVWVPGCATGEEAYSISILLAERLGAAFSQYRVQIFATDIDLDAMAIARRGIYASSSLSRLDQSRIRANFVPHSDRYEINKGLREAVVFARQDVVQDPPFLRIDLISCRNLLIYFQSELQARILAIFHYALNPGGILFLGRSESIYQAESLFDPIDKEARAYRRRGEASRLPIAFRVDPMPNPRDGGRATAKVSSNYEDVLLGVAGRAYIPFSVLISGKFEIRHIHGDPAQLLNLPAGKPAFDLLSMLRKEFRTDLQVLLHQVQSRNMPATGRARRIRAIDPKRSLRMTVHPVPDSLREPLFLVSFEWVVEKVERQASSAATADRELEDELAATREHLQTLVEELETSNEEMQALNEEVQAANEELQASNEELEASNEELQSTNEELSTVNEELQVKSTELHNLAADLENVQSSVDYPLIVVDANFSLLRLNVAASMQFRIMQGAVGRGLHEVSFPGEMPDILPLVKRTVQANEAGEIAMHNVAGHDYTLRITPLMRPPHKRAVGAVLLFADNTKVNQSERSAIETRERLLAVMRNSVSLIAVKEASGRYQFANQRYVKTFGLDPAQITGRTDMQFMPPAIADCFREAEIEVMRVRRDVETEETLRLDGIDHHFLVVRFPLLDPDGAVSAICYQATDITERKRAEEQLRLAARIFDRAAEGVVVTDPAARILTVNDAFSQITGYARAEVVGQTPALLKSGRQDKDFYTEMWTRLLEQGWWQGEIWNRNKSGAVYLEWLSINSVKDESGAITNYVGMFSDITQVKDSQQRIEFLATHDELTALPNRSLFIDRLGLALARAERGRHQMALLFIDLDNFKNVNDTLGHETGDRLLQQAADRLRECLRAEDSIARLGGDEFVVLLERTEKHEAALTAERILAATTAPFEINSHECVVSSSIGIALYPDDGKTSGELMRNADTAMYRTKESGKSGYQFFSAELAERVNRRMEIETGLRGALARNELFLEYQPQVMLADRRVVGVEALVRWRYKDEVIPPLSFIPIAEESKLIVDIEEWVLTEACRQLQEWDSGGLPPVRMAVNISGRHFRQAGMVSRLSEIVTRSGIAPQRICIEITEGVLIDGDVARRMLGDLAAFGFELSIDDFGTGYSSLGYLKRFPISELKIDRSFVQAIDTDADDQAIARAVVALGHTLRTRAIAEGIEQESQLAPLLAMDCEIGQGYLFARPMAGKAMHDWVLYAAQ